MTLEGVRDVSIIFLAILSMIQVVMVIILLYVAIRLTLYVRGRIPPILDSAQSTARAVEATTSTIGDNLVKPVIATASFAVGIRKFTTVLTRGFRRKESRQP